MAITSLLRYATEAAASLPSTVIRRLLVDIRCLPGGEEPAWKHRREGGAEKRHPEGCRAGPPLGVEGVGLNYCKPAEIRERTQRTAGTKRTARTKLPVGAVLCV